MSLRESFCNALNRRNYHIETDDTVHFLDKYVGTYTTYDFAQRRIVTVPHKGGVNITPFKDADREVLQGVYDLMLRHNKNPMALPEEDSAGFHFPNNFNQPGMK